MMQRLFLALDMDPVKRFDVERLRTAIENLPGVTNWREGRDTRHPDSLLFQCELQGCPEGHVAVPIAVQKGLEWVSIGAYCHLGLLAALAIQQAYGEEILAFSGESSPHGVKLSTIRSPDDLAQQLRLRDVPEATLRVKVLYVTVYSEDGTAWRSQEIKNPSWQQIEDAIRRLDKFQHPFLWLALEDNAWDDPDADKFDVVGGQGDYWMGALLHGRQYRYCDPKQGGKRVAVWTSDQGFVAEGKHVCHDLERVLRAVRYFCATGDLDPSLAWE